MKIRIYSVHDQKAEAYLQPFFATTDGQATRTFSDYVQDPQTTFGKHPEDYTLFMIGTFNDQNSEIEKITPLSLGNGIEFSQPQLPLKE